MGQKRKLEVFVSSDQIEFQRLRRKLRNTICGIPVLSCNLMEDRGATPSPPLDASLKAVRESDIYLGVFGRDYSDITIKEYQEAVRLNKPPFIYVKKVNPRDRRVSDFIYNIVKPSFTYFEFKTNNELIKLVEENLQQFIVDTLMMGIQARSGKLGQTMAFISKEQKSALDYITTQDPLGEVKILFDKEKYSECVLRTVAVVEAILRRVLKAKGKIISSSYSIGSLTTKAQKSLLFDNQILNALKTLSIYRNEIVHFGKSTDKQQTKEIMDLGGFLVKSLSHYDIEKRADIRKIWEPFPNIIFRVTQRLLRVCNFPQVCWDAFNDSPYQLRIRIEIHPILGGRDLHPLRDDNINGKSVYEAEPRSYVFANGCFTLPKECADSKEDLIIEIRAIVTDINNMAQGELRLLPKRWKYVRETNSWFYHPQQHSSESSP